MSKSQFICQSCGSVHSKWSGKCESCNEWDTLVEEAIEITPKGMKAKGSNKVIDFVSLDAVPEVLPRWKTNISEMDRVLGGGIVPGSAILIGGDPGIGKSTLLLQMVCNLAAKGVKTAYISGEESIGQIQMRASRLGIKDNKTALGTSNSVRNIVATIKATDGPEVVIIDSIQTMFVDNIDSAPGSVSQVRACSNELIKIAKKRNICVILVGHVTKDGSIAGPRVMEHMVDTVLYFEGDRGHQFRILRAVKNRFGATDEIGVFAMTERGLQEIENPSSLFLSNREEQVSGSCVFTGIEGSRPMLVEVEALVAPCTMATPRRAVVGWDSSRLAMMLAVLETRCNLRFSDKEVYLNIAGGMKVKEPAADLAVAVALISALKDKPFPNETVVFGEIGLSGEVRPVGRTNLRLKESAKLGFDNSLYSSDNSDSKPIDIKTNHIKHVQDLLHIL